MGARGGAKISSYEGFTRLPNLKTALAFEVIYGKPMNELFAGLREGVARDIQNRAKVLRHRVTFQGNDARTAKRRAAVSAIVSPESVTINTQ